MRAVKVWRESSEPNSTDKLTWKVLLKWATASAPSPFPRPGKEAETGKNKNIKVAITSL